VERQTLALGILAGLIPAFFGGLNYFADNRPAQFGVAIAYVAAILAVMMWSSRKPS
jgi:hypothetical protein